jgi:uncharacterized membrane protein
MFELKYRFSKFFENSDNKKIRLQSKNQKGFKREVKSVTAMIFGLDYLFSICFSIPVVIIPRLKNAFFLISLGIGIAIAIVADLFSVSYPFSDFIVYVIAFSGGILLGRVCELPRPHGRASSR